MAAPLSDEQRQQVIDLINAGHSRNQVAKRSGRGTSTVTRIAAELGHDWLAQSDARTQASLTRAHAASSAYSAEHRATSAARNQELIRQIQDRFFDDQERALTVGTGEGTSSVKKFSLAVDQRAMADAAKAIHTLQRTVLDIDRHDNRADQGASDVDDWLRHQMGESVQAAA